MPLTDVWTKQGERLIREKPLFLVPSQSPSVNLSWDVSRTYTLCPVTSSPTSLLAERVASLNQADRDSFYNLSSHVPEGTAESEDGIGHRALSIFQTNAIAAGDQVGIFPHTARLNHGCSRAFNAVYSWREHEGVVVVHALKPVKKGSVRRTSFPLHPTL